MNIFKHIILALSGITLFAACDNISEDNRYLPTEVVVTDRVVLLTEFTGTKCINCPNAAQIAHDLISSYPDNFIAVAMHPKGHGFVDTTHALNLERVEAMEYLRAFGGSQSIGLPTGTIDFTQFNSQYLLGRTEWTARVMQRLGIASDCNVTLTATKTDDKNFTVSVALDPKETLSQNVSLVVWLVESGMIGTQASYEEGTIDNYEHNHAFRECVNGLWGDELGELNEAVTKSYSISIKDEYIPDGQADNVSFSAVAVLVDTDTHQVVQAAEIELK